ncbi:cupredoxin domain-containing protein [Nitrosopumilus adriaticus]|uniref:Blue (Type1) copper domain-containing protein n=1 Tax=Nitrosopumilus adriaticus TaxID=1580092 RepID=A0A0D5C0P0_9ARCH|nr:plastocyanin/azurin family copper-binding protein [Nitrosopumilus adriaticus]AJW70349.1 Blue (Type1) copper domain-containing protein [Nitrosopumilus adriaticus]
MEQLPKKIVLPTIVFAILLISFSVNFANAQSVPEWVKNTALWYGEGVVSEQEFLNMVKFLIENEVIVIESIDAEKVTHQATVTIPNGNSEIASAGFYLPLNLEISKGTTVTWVNDDSVPHNIQSLDTSGKVIDWFNSPPLNTGDKFEFAFEESGVYNYYCSFHPWRVGSITVK